MLALLLAVAPSLSVNAAQTGGRDPALCPPPPAAPAYIPGRGLTLRSQDAEYEDSGRLVLEGDVQISRGRQRLQAERAIYLKSEDRVELEGAIRYQDPYLWLEGPRGTLHPGARRARFEALRYHLVGQGGGRAALLERFGEITRLHDLDYSSCPEERPVWQLQIGELELDHAAGLGKARSAVFKFFKLPILYFPYLSFPIGSRRKSGFLYPALGYSSRNGLDLRVPYYWNIAPQRDATISLRTLSRRGALLGLEYRQLHAGGQGLFYGELLPADLADRKRTRALLRLELEQSLPGGWESELSWRSVSDHRYLEDLGDTLGQTSERRLEQRLALRYQRADLRLAVLLLNFQELAPVKTLAASRLLPELELKYDKRQGGLEWGTHSTLSHFHRGGQATGLRFNLAPRVAYRLRHGHTYLRSAFTLHYTRYQLRHEADGASTRLKRRANRLTPELRLDGGLRLAAGPRRGDAARFLYLFEPRILYRFVPYTDQDRLPLFDSARTDFSRAFLSANRDRFSGSDRIGDDNRLGLLFSTRILDRESARQQAELILGRFFHLRRQRVRLPGEAPTTERGSPLLAALDLDLGTAWNGYGEAQWNLERGILGRGTTSLRYRPHPGRIFNLGYRYREDALRLHQLDVSFHWKLNPRWALAGRWQRSLHGPSRDLDLFLGLERKHCCWQLRLLARRFAVGGGNRHENGLFLEIGLPGLGSVGYDIADLFENRIHGYPANP